MKNRNHLRHKILEILANRYLEWDAGRANILGISYEDIMQAANCDEETLRSVSSVLYANQEVGSHDAHNVKGMYAKEAGVAAYTDEKYLQIAYRKRMDRAKDFVQVIIPIFSLILAIGAIYFKVDSFNKENEKNFRKIDSINNALKIKQQQIETHQRLLEQRIEDDKKLREQILTKSPS